MERTLINTLRNRVGELVRVNGWVEAIRDQKKRVFVVIRDHSGTVQVIHEKDLSREDLSQILQELTPESAVSILGTVVQNSHVKLGGIEIALSALEVSNLASAPLPLDGTSSLDLRMDWRFLDLRRLINNLMFRVQTLAEVAMREFWRENKFIEIHSPKLMGSASESGAELFKLEYFGRPAYLAQSPQFYKQMAMAAGFDRVFEVGPVFRANPSFTTRHDTEFTSVDVEISWVESHEDVMSLEERWLRHILSTVSSELGQEIFSVFGTEVKIPEVPFPRVAMAQAYEILDGMGHKVERGQKGDLDPEGERKLSQYIAERFGHEFVFVTDYPTSVRPFYHMRHLDNPKLTKSFDLLWKGLEVTTGAQREHRYEVLLEQLQEKGLDPNPIQYYLDCFRFGCPPHGGYGFGLTRMLMIMLGLKNVREVTYLYRGPNRLAP